MYPIKINLLSPEKRKYLTRMVYVQFVKNTFISIVFVFCISGITLLGGQSVLQEYYTDVSASLALSGELHADKNKKIEAVNTIIKNVEAVQEMHNLWANKILRIGNSVPSGVILNSIILAKDKERINISGTAIDRDSLLELKENITKLEFVNDIEIPLGQLTEKEDIDFSISIETR
ncbi:MAG: hypothetical protein Q8O88_03245 [bacterium]|nr:hypothetical protein [bacterium]